MLPPYFEHISLMKASSERCKAISEVTNYTG